MGLGRSLSLYFIDGKPDGMLTAEVFNWTGHVLKFPRLQISDALKRPEVANTGVYILLGPIDGIDTAYIGESESVKGRMLDHESKKDWWEQAIVITSAGNGLHKAHVKYLESRLVEIARDVGHTPLENGTKPAKPSLSEADISNMEGFLDTLMMVLPAIRDDMFMQKKRDLSSQPSPQPHTTSNTKTDDLPSPQPPVLSLASTNQASSSHPFSTSPPTFELFVPSHRIKATAILKNNEFVVLKGSSVHMKWHGAPHQTYMPLHSTLLTNGVIVSEDSNMKIGFFKENYAFTSPSAAAATITGRSTNGRKDWKVKGTGQSYNDWETETLAKEESQK